MSIRQYTHRRKTYKDFRQSPSSSNLGSDRFKCVYSFRPQQFRGNYIETPEPSYAFPIIRDYSISEYHGLATNMEESDVQADSPGSQALVFDGVDERVECGAILDFERTDTFSISAWIKTTDNSVVIASKWNSSLPSGYIFTATSTYLGFGVVYNWVVNGLYTSAFCNIGNGEWNHVVVTYNGNSLASGVKFYLNTVLENNITIVFDNLASNISHPSTPFWLGKDYSGAAGVLSGSLADAAVWNKELSITEVSEIYNNTVPIVLTETSCAASLAAWWRCGDAFQLGVNGVRDFSGNGLHGTAMNMEITDVESRYSVGNSLAFDGTDEYVTMGDVLNFERTNAFSVSFWIKSTDEGVYVVSKRSDTTRGYNVSLLTSSTIAMALANANEVLIEVVTSVTVITGAWAHVVTTYDGSSLASGVTVYVNGTSVGLTVVWDTLDTNTILTSTELNISGRNNGAWGLLDGSVADVAVWNKELSLAEVENIYNSGIPKDLTGSSNLVGYWKS